VPNALSDLADKLLQMGTQLGLVLAFAPWAALTLPLVVPAYAAIFAAVRPASRASRRLESAAHAPVYAHFGDALAGRETIGAYGAEAAFCAANAELVGAMSACKVGNEAVNKWAQTLTTQTGCALYAAVGAACVVLCARGALSAAELGLVLLYAASLQRACMDLMMQLTGVETQFVSIERLAEYARLPTEADALEPTDGGVDETAEPVRTGAAPSAAGARLEISRVWLRYAVGRRPALRGLSLAVPAGAKVAVCGRTGCGKSSLFAAIARLYPLERGDVRIDGASLVRRGGLSLAAARAAVRVVSQDALLLDGTLRDNLAGRAADDDEADGQAAGPAPLVATDAALWAALEAVGVAARVRALPDGLGTAVGRGDFSEGERQLLSLARALVGGPRLLLADEPTACVDLASDARVHAVLLGLRETTVLMICHRLQHVGRFDEVLVMRDGRIAERGPPVALLRAPGSRLARLCARAGLDADELLRGAAASP
jgi:ABC-type multidrug transport system fused ATPase/permease subunit